MSTLEKLEDLLDRRMDEFMQMDVGDENYKTLSDTITKLTEQLAKLKKLELEEEAESHKTEIDTKRVEIEEKKISIDEQKTEIEKTRIDIESDKVDVERDKMTADIRKARMSRFTTIADISVKLILGVATLAVSIWGTKNTILAAKDNPIDKLGMKYYNNF